MTNSETPAGPIAARVEVSPEASGNGGETARDRGPSPGAENAPLQPRESLQRSIRHARLCNYQEFTDL